MPSSTDGRIRPVYYDRVNDRLLAEPVAAGPWKVVSLTAAPINVAGGTVTGILEIGVSGKLSFEGATANNFETELTVVDPTADRVITLPDATTTVAGLGVVQSFSAAQRGTVSALGNVSGTVTLDFATANNFSMTLPSNSSVVLASPTNLAAGQSGAIVITQSASVASTVSYGGYWKFRGGAPTMSTSLGSVSVLAYYVESVTRIAAQLLTDFA